MGNRIRQGLHPLAKLLANQDKLLPKTIKDGKLVTCLPDWWTSGFFPGSLWYLYEYSHNNDVKNMAELFTKRVENQKFTTNNHTIISNICFME